MTSAPLEELRETLFQIGTNHDLDPDSTVAREAQALTTQLDDYIVPRIQDLDAPLLMVVGGSTGSGKSTIVNSLVGEEVSAASAIRPTTRRPVLVCHPTDAHWFESSRVLPGLTRVKSQGVTSTPTGPQELELHFTDAITPGVAILDAPDIDSVVDANRNLAQQLLAAADVWLFVTTAARYADAVPWQFLHEAHHRNVPVTLVLNRVPADALNVVVQDFKRLVAGSKLPTASLFAITESPLTDGLLAREQVAPIRTWMDALAADASARKDLARQSVRGAIRRLSERVEEFADLLDQQDEHRARMRAILESEIRTAVERIRSVSADGTLMRGEVLKRWQEFVGAGAWFDRLQENISSWRDRLAKFFFGKAIPPPTPVERAVEDTFAALIRSEADHVVLNVLNEWRAQTGENYEDVLRTLTPTDELIELIDEQLLAWQRGVVRTIREEGDSKRATARILSTGINALGVSLMLIVFMLSGGLTGSEVVIAGGTAAASQAVLVALFGEDAVRKMAVRARDNLTARAEEVLTNYASPLAATVQARREGQPLREILTEIRSQEWAS